MDFDRKLYCNRQALLAVEHNDTSVADMLEIEDNHSVADKTQAAADKTQGDDYGHGDPKNDASSPAAHPWDKTV